jgi:hypothetical protein
MGLTAIRSPGVTELPIDVLFKKSWRLSPQVEFMVGGGPELIHATGPEHGTFWGLESVVDFMFWQWKDVGWYVEPGYQATFRNGSMRNGMGFAAGLILGR